MIRNLLISMRPKQWSKNILVFAGLLFARDMFELDKIKETFIAFFLFCLVSSGVYLINDIVDRHKDALHPIKKNRPIAAGTLSPSSALVTALLFILFSVFSAYVLNWHFAMILLLYFVLTLGYTFYLKQVVILDVLIIASGFVFRAIGGALAIGEQVSNWLIICTIFLALFLALGKRRAEYIALGENAKNVRKTLAQYDRAFLDQMIIISTAACLMAYALYTLDEETIQKFATRNLVLTLPFVIYGLFRYLYLVYHENLGESPENAILGDRSILVCVALYALTVLLILYY